VSFNAFARKGSVLIESKLPGGKSVQFSLTHLQAKEKLGAIRVSQLKQIKGMLSKHKRAGVPQFLIGDLNIDATEKEFQEGLDLMGMKQTELTGPINHTNVIDCYRDPGKEKEWIDHMWVNDETQFKDSAMQVREVSFEYKGKTCMASDHHAVEGVFTFAD
jgi:endonuclease/exonuclease/phosphatase family metal-dependent hydrolase